MSTDNSWQREGLLHDATSDMTMISQLDNRIAIPTLRGEIRIHEPMSRHISWRVGGYADRYYEPADLDDFVGFLQKLPHESIYIIGLGSNLLIRDGGLRGTVIALYGRLSNLRLIEQDQGDKLIYVGAGVVCAKVARFAARHHLAGAEFLAGIPGTVGGALAMNAGCFGSETWKIVEYVKVINRSGQVLNRQPWEYMIDYRTVRLRRSCISAAEAEWFVGAYLRLPYGDQNESQHRIKQLLVQRLASQPLNQPSAGSVFRNPLGDYAARLIEACGLKGYCVGDAMVSPKHANFIVNKGNASATDIEMLMMVMRERVKQETGIELIQEVQIIGDIKGHT